MPQKRMECFRLLFDHLAWIEHQFLIGISDSIEEMKEAVTKVIDTLTQEDIHGAFQKLLER